MYPRNGYTLDVHWDLPPATLKHAVQGEPWSLHRESMSWHFSFLLGLEWEQGKSGVLN